MFVYRHPSLSVTLDWPPPNKDIPQSLVIFVYFYVLHMFHGMVQPKGSKKIILCDSSRNRERQKKTTGMRFVSVLFPYEERLYVTRKENQKTRRTLSLFPRQDLAHLFFVVDPQPYPAPGFRTVFRPFRILIELVKHCFFPALAINTQYLY